MKTFIVTTDLSKESGNAFKVAEEYARELKAKIILVAVVEDPSQAALAYSLDFPVFPSPDIQKQLVARIQTEVKSLAEKNFASVAHETVVLEALGPVHSEIIKYAKEKKADLIIMATHGRKGVSRMLIGSVTDRVIREAQCPVMTVPADTSTAKSNFAA